MEKSQYGMMPQVVKCVYFLCCICRENIVHLDIYYKKLRYFVIEQKEGKTLPNLVCKYSSYSRFFFQSKKLEFAIDVN